MEDYLHLPMPPSANRLWRNVGKKTLLAASARSYYAQAHICIKKQLGTYKPLTGNLRMILNIYPANKRKIDLDNRIKSVGDALTKSRVIADDSQIKEILAKMHPPTGEKNGYCTVRVEKI